MAYITTEGDAQLTISNVKFPDKSDKNQTYLQYLQVRKQDLKSRVNMGRLSFLPDTLRSETRLLINESKENMPQYIKKALRQKDRYKVMPRETKRTIANLTLTQVFAKIKDITKALNLHAKKNGYFVDYNFRVLENN